MEAALAFSSGGSLPCYEVAVSPAALAEAAILPLVDLLASECTDAQREAATQALHSPTSKVANIFDPRETPLGGLLVRTGGVSPLVALLREGSVAQKEYAAGTLHNLANTSAHRTAIADAGAIVPLVLLARDGTDTQKEHSALALGDLAFQHATNRVAITKAGGAEVLASLAQDGTAMQQSIAYFALHNLSNQLEGSASVVRPP